MTRLSLERGVPDRIQCDNGSEFISKALDKWAYEQRVVTDSSRPGKPADNALIESFNGSFRDDCLNANWFLSIEDAQEKTKRWRIHYNKFRPHSSLEDMTPNKFAAQVDDKFESRKSTLLAGTVYGWGQRYLAIAQTGVDPVVDPFIVDPPDSEIIVIRNLPRFQSVAPLVPGDSPSAARSYSPPQGYCLGPGCRPSLTDWPH